MDQEPIDATYITAMVKGGSNGFALKGADATAGPLKSLYDGARPAHYQPMKKQGSIILGIGGDNSDSAQGTFYEGVMTSGYASNATDAAVQANIVAAGCECSRSHLFALPLSLLLTYLLLRRWEVSAPPINPGFAHSASAFRRQPRQQAPSQSTSPQPQDQQRIKPLGLGAICQLVALSRSGGGTGGAAVSCVTNMRLFCQELRLGVARGRRLPPTRRSSGRPPSAAAPPADPPARRRGRPCRGGP